MYRKTVLDNGVRIVTAPMKEVNSVAVGIWANVGSRYEDRSVCGISHFLEHVVFKGTRSYSCQKIKESIEGVGGSFNGFTSEEATCYMAKMPARYLGLALDILSEMVLVPTLPPEEIEKERTVILEEIKMYRDLPQSHVHELMDELLWPGQPLGTSILGTHESVSALGRSGLDGYRRKHYTAPNVVISVAGRIPHAKVCAQVRRVFARLPGAPVNGFCAARISQDAPQATISHKETEQTHLIVGFHGLRRDDPLKYAVNVMNIILGGNSSSRLFNQIREKRGLAYEIGSLAKRLHDTGSFLVHAGVDNARVVQTLGLIMQELAAIRDRAVSTGELKRAKEFLLGQLSLALEDPMDQMLWIGDSTLMLDRTFSLNEVIRQVNRVRAADVREAARRIFKNETLNLALIGPQKPREKDIRGSLHIG